MPNELIIPSSSAHQVTECVLMLCERIYAQMGIQVSAQKAVLDVDVRKVRQAKALQKVKEEEAEKFTEEDLFTSLNSQVYHLVSVHLATACDVSLFSLSGKHLYLCGSLVLFWLLNASWTLNNATGERLQGTRETGRKEDGCQCLPVPLASRSLFCVCVCVCACVRIFFFSFCICNGAQAESGEPCERCEPRHWRPHLLPPLWLVLPFPHPLLSLRLTLLQA